MLHVCLWYVPCGLVITCWERAGLFALSCVVLSCVFVTFPYGVVHVFYCIVSFRYLCLSSFCNTFCYLGLFYYAFFYLLARKAFYNFVAILLKCYFFLIQLGRKLST